MQELRDFELDEAGTPVRWRAKPGQRIVARHGWIWLTIEGQLTDVWLSPGQQFALPPGEWVWISGAAAGAGFTLAEQAAPLWRRWLAALLRPGRSAAGRGPSPAGWRPAPQGR